MSEPKTMHKIREVLRLRLEAAQGLRAIALSVGGSPSTIQRYLTLAASAGLAKWEDVRELSEDALASRLFPDGRQQGRPASPRAAMDEWYIHEELRRPGVQLMLLWQEYAAAAQAKGEVPYSYSQYCDHYAAYRKRLSISMRQVHIAGERSFVDYSGKKLYLTDPTTGERTEVELFVMVLGASSYTYAEASRSQMLPEFCASLIRGLEYFGGSTQVLVPDQLRSAVSGPDRYDPDINRTLCNLAAHYEMVVLPARPLKPKDKAKVEVAVQIVQRWIVARLRNETFATVAELNARIRELLTELNAKPFQKRSSSRKSFYERFDKPALRALPSEAFPIGLWKKGRVAKDTHVDCGGHAYSVPHVHVGEKVEVYYTPSLVQVFAGGERIASHPRSFEVDGATTQREHLPQAHQEHGKWTEERMLAHAKTYGASVGEVVAKILAGYPNPSFGFRAALGVTALANAYGSEALNKTCEWALATLKQIPRRKTLLALLKRPRPNLAVARDSRTLGDHEHIRGADYFITCTEETITTERIH
jgi:transposase